ncbi:hypothetical protein FDF40_03685 [Clostridium sporogenes]|uniref:hypothetical protein n=1 Tax=Bacillota TaxID=1239 RepID=UPI0011BF63D5|nr:MULTISPECIES: hypothetical protein [Bacillota]NFT30578.1 hypothetical protein [Clostridium sporogenes]TWM14732.1 hypothetical protein CHCC15091_1773 [Bacillus licheniformis]GIN25542.1 hypothetical protein J31TS2_21220 [Bacillus licheniformis]GIN29719.1 hypothetical protein J2TS5_17580 [Bacillus licheniformis]
MKKIATIIIMSLLSVGVVYFAYQTYEWKESAETYKQITLDQNNEIDYREKLLGKALNKEVYSYKESEDLKDILYTYDNKGKSEKEIYQKTDSGTDSRFNHVDKYKFDKIDDDGNYNFKSVTDGSDYFLLPDEVKKIGIKKGDTVNIVSNEYGEFVSARVTNK